MLPQFAYTSTVGDPNLSPERLWQVDAGLSGEFQYIRGGVQGFYAWINDYITLDFLDPPIGNIFGFVNTDRATLSGFEMAGEVDLTSRLTGFANVSYVEGRDHTRDNTVSTNRAAFQPGSPRSGSLLAEEPLPVIQPLQSIAGIRWGPRTSQAPWAVEFFARMIDGQDRVAATLREQTTPGFTTYNIRSYWQASDNCLLSAGVENLTDRNYREHFDTRTFSTVFQPGILFYFGTQLTY